MIFRSTSTYRIILRKNKNRKTLKKGRAYLPHLEAKGFVEIHLQKISKLLPGIDHCKIARIIKNQRVKSNSECYKKWIFGKFI